MMSEKWFWDEFIQKGTDYTSKDEIEAYDKRMSFRDIKKENLNIIESLDLKADQTVLEIGTGTGELAIYLSEHCKKIYAIDVSRQIIDFATGKAGSKKNDNIIFSNEGFLSMDYKDRFDAVITQFALHHLPDLWKGVALLNIYDSLKSGGKFYLKDVIFSFEIRDYYLHLNRWITEFEKQGNPSKEIEVHIKEEFSTFTWIIEEMIKKAGFSITKKSYEDFIVAEYICTKD